MSKDALSRHLAPHADRAYAALRIVAGLMLSFHGMQKIFGLLTSNTYEVMSQLWIGGVIELVGGLLVAVGLFTLWAAFICSGTMAVAYFQFHWKLQLDSGFFPAVNKGELALLYAFVFLYVACRGAVCCGVDTKK